MRYTLDELQNMIDNARNCNWLCKLRRQEVVAPKKKCGLKIAIIIISSLAILCAVAYFLYNYLAADDTDPEADFDDDFDEDFFEDDEEDEEDEESDEV